MHNPAVDGRLVSKALLTLVGVFVAAALFFGISASKASAGNFCGTPSSPAWVNPYGQGGDKCWGNALPGLNYAAVITFQRAGCVTLAEGTNLLTAWVCGAAGSNPSNAAEVYKWNYSNWWKGVVRNNNVSYGTNITGGHNCLGGC